MSVALLFQGAAVFALVVLFLGWLYLRGSGRVVDAKTTFRQLLLWYPASAPWLLVRTPLLYLLVDVLGMTLWAAVIVEFVIERPLFFLTAREITRVTAPPQK